MLKIFAAVALIFVLVKSEIFERPCRTLEELGGAKREFNYPAYKGPWYQIERYNNIFIGDATDCNTASYTTSTNETYTYTVDYISRILATGQLTGISGISRLSFPNENPLRGLLNATMGAGTATDVLNYIILDTDYVNFSFVVNCANINATHSSESYFLFGRSYPLSAASRARADEIAARVLDKSRIRPVFQGIECVL